MCGCKVALIEFTYYIIRQTFPTNRNPNQEKVVSWRLKDCLCSRHCFLMAAALNLALIPVVAAEGFNPVNYLQNIQRDDGLACSCGQWYFYSATCGGVFQQHPNRCGSSRTRRGTNTA